MGDVPSTLRHLVKPSALIANGPNTETHSIDSGDRNRENYSTISKLNTDHMKPSRNQIPNKFYNSSQRPLVKGFDSLRNSFLPSIKPINYPGQYIVGGKEVSIDSLPLSTLRTFDSAEPRTSLERAK